MIQKSAKRFIQEDKEGYLFFALLILGVLAGTCYALSIKEDTTFFYLFNQYISLEYLTGSRIERIQYSLVTHGKKVFLFFGCMLFKVTVPIAEILFILLCFSYGFVSACFILLYGIKGVLFAFFSLGFQSIGILSILFYFKKQAKKMRNSMHSFQFQIARVLLGKALILFGVILIVDSLLQPFIQQLISFMI